MKVNLLYHLVYLLALPSWKIKYKFNPIFDLGIGKWMGDTNIESDNTKFLDAIVLHDNLSDETEEAHHW